VSIRSLTGVTTFRAKAPGPFGKPTSVTASAPNAAPAAESNADRTHAVQTLLNLRLMVADLLGAFA
jgi:hypothetical protein